MQLIWTSRFRRSYRAAPESVKRSFDRKVALLLLNIRHPSLRSHKQLKRGPDIWQARVTRSWRFYFTIAGNTIFLEDITPHPK